MAAIPRTGGTTPPNMVLHFTSLIPRVTPLRKIWSLNSRCVSALPGILPHQIQERERSRAVANVYDVRAVLLCCSGRRQFLRPGQEEARVPLRDRGRIRAKSSPIPSSRGYLAISNQKPRCVGLENRPANIPSPATGPAILALRQPTATRILVRRRRSILIHVYFFWGGAGFGAALGKCLYSSSRSGVVWSLGAGFIRNVLSGPWFTLQAFAYCNLFNSFG
ncbi:hypothetical protein B0H16DRAFT_1455068 [Mycena metata]|uniref:Uncharacterized protein n=1 Tax=Mycena metata TaxID=1033252 RepID=A0AAD7NJJ4_9AGAR|nr:hypothetical protein B0H16DRAFT_1455068 [Mycena metata]